MRKNNYKRINPLKVIGDIKNLELHAPSYKRIKVL